MNRAVRWLVALALVFTVLTAAGMSIHNLVHTEEVVITTGPVTTVAATEASSTTGAPTVPTVAVPPTTIGVLPTIAVPTSTLAPSTLAPSTLAPSTLPPSTLAPSTLPPSTLPPTTLPPTTVPPSTLPPTTLPPTTVPPTTVPPTTVAAGPPPVTMAELAKHASAASCWLLISGTVYDVTTYLSGHPGGVNTILPWCGKESTEAFATEAGEGQHSRRAYSALEPYSLGPLVG